MTIPDAFAGCSTRETGEPASFGGGGSRAKPERHKMPQKNASTSLKISHPDIITVIICWMIFVILSYFRQSYPIQFCHILYVVVKVLVVCFPLCVKVTVQWAVAVFPRACRCQLCARVAGDLVRHVSLWLRD